MMEKKEKGQLLLKFRDAKKHRDAHEDMNEGSYCSDNEDNSDVDGLHR